MECARLLPHTTAWMDGGILAGNELPCTGSRLQMPAWHHCGCPDFASCTAALELKAGQIRDASVCQERKLNGSNSA